MQGGIFLCQAQNLTSEDWEKDVEPKRGNRRLNQDTRAGKAHLAQGSRGKDRQETGVATSKLPGSQFSLWDSTPPSTPARSSHPSKKAEGKGKERHKLSTIRAGTH